MRHTAANSITLIHGGSSMEDPGSKQEELILAEDLILIDLTPTTIRLVDGRVFKVVDGKLTLQP